MEDHAEIVDVDGSGERKSLANLEESLGGGGEGAQEAASNSPAHSASRSASPIIECANLVKMRTMLHNLTPDMWTPEHDAQISHFISSVPEQLLLVFIDEQNGLTLCNTLPPFPVKELVFFAREENAVVTPENFSSVVQFGTVQGSCVDTVLRAMHNLFAPSFFENTSWPDSLHNEFSAQLHKFMAHLTDAQHKTVGHTVLYVPDEGPAMASPEAHKDKELVHRLEVVMIHWTRQIKEVLASQESLETANSSGPLEEIEFWRARCEDLSGLTQQLDKPGVVRVTTIVEKAKSSYLAPFRKLSQLIQESHANANNCLKFISLLSDPCRELASSEPSTIPKLLPRLLNTVRVIWMNSDHYRSRERLNSLLRKVSSDIIKRCCSKVSLDDIFDGHVERSRIALVESIQCCQDWKDTYDRISQVHNKFSSEGWMLDEASIFAQVDAFIQRCRDLLEVVEGQEHFARYSEGKKKPIPCFGGCRGLEVTRSWKEIEHTFEKHLAALKAIRKTILDVKVSSWHDDYSRFRAGVKELEVMVQNTINAAFMTVTTVQEGVELLEVFAHLAKRETVKRVMDRRTVDLYTMFNEELSLVKKEFTRQSPTLPPSQPRFAGVATWARALKKRIDVPMEYLEQAYFLHEKGVGEEVRFQYVSLAQSIEEFVGKTFNNWVITVEKELTKYLEVPLMVKSRSGTIEASFNRKLLKLFGEMRYWERLRFEVPHYATGIYHRCEELRVLRENVLLIVRDYNRIISSLLPNERSLFRERIRSLDKKIRPGMTKLTYASEGILDYFVSDCRLHAQKVRITIDNYKASNRAIGASCRMMSEMLLVRLDGKRVYEENDFEVEQYHHRASVQQKLEEVHNDIVHTMRKTFEVFRGDGGDVRTHWLAYMEQMDRMVEEALRLNVKWSLQELSRAINGDGKTMPNPLFKVKVKLSDQVGVSNLSDSNPVVP